MGGRVRQRGHKLHSFFFSFIYVIAPYPYLTPFRAPAQEQLSRRQAQVCRTSPWSALHRSSHATSQQSRQTCLLR